MKMKLTVLLLGLATCGLVSCFAQDNNTNPANPVPADTAPAKPAPPDAAPAIPAPVTPAPTNAVPADAASTNAAPVVPTAAAPTELAQAQAAAPAADQPKADAAPAPPANPNEPVPLIVIDEVPLTDAIRNLARQSNLNFQFDPRITSTNQPNVSIRFENVTAQEALTAVLENYNLALVKDPKARIARITIKDPKAEDPLVSRIIQLKYSDPTNMVTLVKSTLSARSLVVADSRTSQLIVTTTEKELDGLMNLVEKLDTATRQVLIEARLLETTKNPQSIKGIDWTGTFGAQRVTFGNGRFDGTVPANAQQLGQNVPQNFLYGPAPGQGAPVFVGNGGIIANEDRRALSRSWTIKEVLRDILPKLLGVGRNRAVKPAIPECNPLRSKGSSPVDPFDALRVFRSLQQASFDKHLSGSGIQLLHQVHQPVQFLFGRGDD